jgi:CheY-like chemotaxis protein
MATMAKRLLLVASTGYDRTAIRDVLQESGFEVMESSSGADASPSEDRTRPDLVLLDHEADMDARLALRSQLGTDEAHSPIPVVEMCLTRPDLFPAAANVLARLSAGY